MQTYCGWLQNDILNNLCSSNFYYLQSIILVTQDINQFSDLKLLKMNHLLQIITCQTWQKTKNSPTNRKSAQQQDFQVKLNKQSGKTRSAHACESIKVQEHLMLFAKRKRAYYRHIKGDRQ